MKKILMVCEAFGGGVFSYVKQLCNDMVDEFDVYLAYSVRPQTPHDYKELIDKKVTLIEVPDFGKFKKIKKTIKFLRNIEKNINPDIIHLHSSKAGGIGRLAFKGKTNSVVYTPHGYNYLMVGEKTFKGRYYKFLEKILGKKAITLACCESEEKEAKKFSKKTAFIETGINVDELSQLTINIGEKRKNEVFTVVTLGRMCLQKQPKLFNQIALLTPEAKFVWIGSGELQNELTAPNIEIISWKPRLEALEISKNADAFVLCSLGEAIAMSLIETMFLKTLCIVSNAVGNKDVVKNNENGFVCNNAIEYSNAIKSAMTNYPYEYIENSYSKIMSTYNTKIMKKKYVIFYNSLKKTEA